MHLPQLRRVRWAVRGALALGVAASVAANVLHALPNPISQAIAGWPPLALLLTIELISRVPMHKKTLAAARLFATAAISGIAAWVSYWHMAGVAAHYGESETSAYLLPLSVDGLIVVASVCLVELASRIRVLEEQRREATRVAAEQAAAEQAQQRATEHEEQRLAQAAHWAAVEASAAASAAATAAAAQPVAATPAPVVAAPIEPAPAPRPARPEIPVSPAIGPFQAPVPVGATAGGPPAGLNGHRISPPSLAMAVPPRKATTATIHPRPGGRAPMPPVKAMPPASGVSRQSLPRQRRPAAETAALVAEIQARHPGISPAELAQRLGISKSRLRAVRREVSTSNAA